MNLAHKFVGRLCFDFSKKILRTVVLKLKIFAKS